MTRASSIRSAWTIMSAIWRRHQGSVLGLLAITFLFGWLFRATPGSEVVRTIGNLGMGLSLFLTFIICGFTEGDRKMRSWGFPARLFTLPVSTPTLIAAPMIYGVVTIGLVYLVWAGFALSAQGLPLTWPFLYLGVGMICYQCILWSMARYRITRIVVLGYTGALFAMGWLAFRSGSGAASSLDWDLGDATRRLLCWMLVAMAVIAYAIAWIAVDVQRRGGFGRWSLGWRHNDTSRAAWPASAIEDLPPRQLPSAAKTASLHQRRFRAASDAQFWFEWRRHGKLLLMATAGVLFIIMVPAPFVAPISSEMTGLALCWIVVTPLLIAFVLGKGLGKSDLWSGDSGSSPFLSTRPLSNTERIGAKMKMGAAAALASWALLILMTSGWLWFWCDREQLARGWVMLEQSCTPIRLYSACAMILLALIFLTFRFLVGSLYVGLSGKRWLMNLAACGVFCAIFGGMFGALALSQLSADFSWVRDKPGAFVVGLLIVFTIKLGATLTLVRHGCQRQWVTAVAAGRYAVFWVIATGVLVAGVWILPLIDESWKWVLAALALFVVPLLRVSFAPVALASSFRH